MNKRINKKIDSWWDQTKMNLKKKVENNPNMTSQQLLLLIYEQQSLIIKESDYQKRQRAKNVVPLFERCAAKRANGEQCTRRRRESENYCGTHAKGTPHGTIDMAAIENPLKKVNVWIQEISGISYYIDGEGNVYNPQDVFQNKTDPRKIFRYEKKSDGTYVIIS